MKRSHLLIALSLFSTTWAQINPFYQWARLNATEGQIRNLVFAEGVFFASMDMDLNPYHYRSLDSGKTWKQFDPFVTFRTNPNHNTLIQFDPTSKGFYLVSDTSLYVSTAQSAAWTKIASFEFLGMVSKDGQYLIAQDSGLLVSVDGGAQWKRTQIASPYGMKTILAADSCFYAIDSESPIWVSRDGGGTWNPSGSGLTDSAKSIVRYKNSVIASVGSRLMRTTDDGKSWSLWNGNLQDNAAFSYLQETNQQLFLWKSDSGFSSSTQRLYFSNDGGQIWSRLNLSSEFDWIQPKEMRFTSIGNLFYGASRPNSNQSYGLLYTQDTGKTWQPSRMGLTSKGITGLGIHQNRMTAFNEEGVFNSNDTGRSWTKTFHTDSMTQWTAFGGIAPNLALGNQHGTIHLTEDAGDTWHQAPPLPSPSRILSVTIWRGRVYAGTSTSLWVKPLSEGDWQKMSLPKEGAVRFLTPSTNSLLITCGTNLWEIDTIDSTIHDLSEGIDVARITHFWSVDERFYAGNTVTGMLYQWLRDESHWKSISVPLPFYAFAGTKNHLRTNSFASGDTGKTWQAHDRFAPRNLIYLTFSNGSFYGTDDEGGVWKYLQSFDSDLVAIRPRAKTKAEKPFKHTIPIEWSTRTYRADGRQDIFPRRSPRSPKILFDSEKK